MKINTLLLLISMSCLFSCQIKKEEASYSYKYDCGKTIIFTFPDLYIYNGNDFKKLLKFENYIEILGYNNNYIYLNEVITPYKKNKIHIYNIKTKEVYNQNLTNIDCVINGGNLFSSRILESDKEILLEIGCNEKKIISVKKADFSSAKIVDKTVLKEIEYFCQDIDSTTEKFIYHKNKKNHQIDIKGISYEIPIQYVPVIDEN